MTTSAALRPFDVEADLDRLLELQRGRVPAHRRWDRARAGRELADIGRAGGANVVVAWRQGQAVGFAGWVALGAGDGEFYGAPVVANEGGVLDSLVERVEGEARTAGADWVRCTTWPEDDVKAAVLAERGYRRVFEFVELAGEVAALRAPAVEMPPELHRVAYSGVEAEAYVEIFNECFRDLPNAPSMTVELAAESLREQPPLGEASQFWADDQGRYQAFSITLATGYIDSFGVRERYRGRGLANAMMALTIAAASDCGCERLTSTVAGSNAASLRVHQRAGFSEVERCQAWQRDLT